jgi:membrane protein DedA with SNARE-associated domain
MVLNYYHRNKKPRRIGAKVLTSFHLRKTGLFIIYTTTGAGLWVVVLALLGYYLGVLVEDIDTTKNYIPQLVEASRPYIHQILYFTLTIISVVTAIYIWNHKSKKI